MKNNFITKGWLKISAIIIHSNTVGADLSKDGYTNAVNDTLSKCGHKPVLSQHVSRLLSEAVNGKTKETNLVPYLKKDGDSFVAL